MQIASSAYSSSIPHSHYHSYYHLHPPGPQDHDLKRQYLALLPPQQIIELCLTFDLHIPPYIKCTIWPPDLNAAIALLQNQNTAQSSTEKPAEDVPPRETEAVMDSLKSPDPPESNPTEREATPAAEPQPPDKDVPPSTPDPSSTSGAPSNEPSATSPSAENLSTSSTVTPTAASTPVQTSAPVPAPTPAPAAAASTPAPPPSVPPMPMPQPQYPYPYGHPQAAYPISPYYGQAGSAYSYPYAYATSMQAAYHQPAPAAYPPQPSVYNSMVPLSHPPQQQPPQMEGGDDLPSYEEMIVEALTGCSDPEGWAPKDLFAWMASRYPLQSNFRPSASQALQKAFKRGRFEKSSNGKYRLSASWEGGNTTRRTTRRPQTQPAQSTPAAAPVPPFTHAPLVHHHNHTPAAAQPYGYPAYSQTTYASYPQAQPSTSTAPGTIAGAAAAAPVAAEKPPGIPSGLQPPATAATTSAVETEHSADAYEAAQNILNAINFGDLYQLSSDGQSKTGSQAPGQNQQPQAANDHSTNNGVEHLLSHVQAMLANGTASQGAPPGAAGATNSGMPMHALGQEQMASAQVASGGSVVDPRAELQGQLALLAAQLAEIAQLEDAATAPAPSMVQELQQQQQGVPVPVTASVPPPTMAHSYQQQSQSAPAPVPTTSVPPPPAAPQIPPSTPAAAQPAMFIHAPAPVAPSAAPNVSDVSQGMSDSDLAAELEAEMPIQLEEEEESDEDDDDMEEII